MKDKNITIASRSEEVQEILTRVPNWMVRWGNLVFLLLFLIVMGGLWFVKYPVVIQASAIITTDPPPIRILVRATGRLEKVLIADNQIVQSEDLLAIIENTASSDDILFLQGKIDSVDFSEPRTFQSLENLPPLNLGDIEASYATFLNNYNAYLLYNEMQPSATESLTNSLTLSELKERNRNLAIQKETGMQTVKLKSSEIGRYQVLFDKGVISAQDYEKKKMEQLQMQSTNRAIDLEISKVNQAISLHRLNYTYTDYNRIEKERKLSDQTVQAFHGLKNALARWERTYVLKANDRGRISYFGLIGNNENVLNGQQVLTLLPTSVDSFIAKVKIPQYNLGRLEPGQRVHIALASYPETEYGILHGKVSKISTVPDSNGSHLIDVRLPKILQTSFGTQIKFRQEMIATAEIITEDLRLLERLFYQLRDILPKNRS